MCFYPFLSCLRHALSAQVFISPSSGMHAICCSSSQSVWRSPYSRLPTTSSVGDSHTHSLWPVNTFSPCSRFGFSDNRQEPSLRCLHGFAQGNLSLRSDFSCNRFLFLWVYLCAMFVSMNCSYLKARVSLGEFPRKWIKYLDWLLCVSIPSLCSFAMPLNWSIDEATLLLQDSCRKGLWSEKEDAKVVAPCSEVKDGELDICPKESRFRDHYHIWHRWAFLFGVFVDMCYL